eukprot:726771-Amphidinium_carterae.1
MTKLPVVNTILPCCRKACEVCTSQAGDFSEQEDGSEGEALEEEVREDDDVEVKLEDCQD